MNKQQAVQPSTYPVETKIRIGTMLVEKRPHGWVDLGGNEVVVDESLIGTTYQLESSDQDIARSEP